MKYTCSYADNNLIQETLEYLHGLGKSPKDILFVVCCDKKTNWDNFKKLGDIFYDNGFGSQEINKHLKIVGKDWWLERYEYDGSEGWSYKTLPTIPQDNNFTIKEVIESDVKLKDK
jgi:hypothetical protein